MKSKKGFTLLEVLLVIDILVIISLIAIPIVMNNIEESKKGAFKQDVNSVFRSAEVNLRTTVPNTPTCYSLDTVDVTHKDKFISGKVCKDSNHNYTVKKLCTKDYCFNGPLETGIIAAYEPLILPAMQSASLFENGAYLGWENSPKIVNANFVDYNVVPDNIVVSWDLSLNQDGSVIGWIITNDTDATKYDLYIGGDGGVQANPDSSYLFFGLFGLKEINFDHFYTSSVVGMKGMFETCQSLTTLNLSNFNTSAVSNMSRLFSGCINLTTLNLSNFNTSNVTNMQSMFGGCTNLTTLNLSNFNTSNVTNMGGMFTSCTNLTTLNLSNFDTSQVARMYYLFNGCTNLTTLNLSNFNTSAVTDMQGMFNGCTNLTTLNLKSFDTNAVDIMILMFDNTPLMNRIDVTTGKWVTSAMNTNMFRNSGVTNVTYN
jgi:prepilin-type N-terminal cleavage/methylation domain-containing protein